MNAEEWRPIPGHPGYDVSNLGRVRSWHPHNGQPVPRIRKPHPGTQGRLQVTLGRKTRKVHNLVTEAFLGPAPVGQEVRHLDSDKTNNHLSNLAYGTHSENMRDRVESGKDPYASRTHCSAGHPFDDANTYWRPRGWRACRICMRAAKARARRRRQLAGVAAPPHP